MHFTRQAQCIGIEKKGQRVRTRSSFERLVRLTFYTSGHYEGIQPLIADGKLVDGGQLNTNYWIPSETNQLEISQALFLNNIPRKAKMQSSWGVWLYTRAKISMKSEKLYKKTSTLQAVCGILQT